ncbi:hypothetical protein D9M69_644440 [compost metagenome]
MVRIRPRLGTCASRALSPANSVPILSTRFSFPEKTRISEYPVHKVIAARQDTVKACFEVRAFRAQIRPATRGSAHQGPRSDPIAPNIIIKKYSITF